MAIIWNFLHGASDGNALSGPAVVAFYKPLFGASPSFATTTGFVMQKGTSMIAFEGSFTVTPFFPPSITGGMITGFKVYEGNVEMWAASGHAVDYQALTSALAVAKVDPQEYQGVLDLFESGPMTVNGSEDADALGGGASADVVYGRGAGDVISTGGGDDVVYGGDGYDHIRAEGGNDLLWGGAGGDHLLGGDGSDTVDYSEKIETVAVTLSGPTSADVMVGGAVEDTVISIENVLGGSGNDTLRGDGFINRLSGGVGDDSLNGSGGNDVLFGDTGADHVAGDAGNDEIHGGLGNDTLSGGIDSDRFVFDIKPGKKAGADTITDFATGFDRIVLDSDVFRKLDDEGALKAKYLAIGGADDGNDFITYKEGSGKLFYDKDGDGHHHGKLIAVLENAPHLHGGDFLVV